MENIFQGVKLFAPKFNKFDLSHEYKSTVAMADLIPILCQEVFPGETFKGRPEIFMRFNPLLAPVMHEVNVFTNTFFVPWRILWDEYDPFITGGEDGEDQPVYPKLVINEANAGATRTNTLMDYFGIPQMEPDGGWAGEVKISALPFKAYAMIWNEYYRDQNLQAKINFNKNSGDVNPTDFIALTTLRQRAWEKDYLTSALPFEQRGPAVVTPLNGIGSVTYKETTEVKKFDGTPAGVGDLNSDLGGQLFVASEQSRVENIDEVNLTSAGVSINDLRVASRLQEWYERAARGGSRLVEMLRSMFGAKSSDARLQRPEYLSGSKGHVVISEVLQTSETVTTPLGTMGGHAYANSFKGEFTYKAEEHGFIITLMSILPRTAYQQGLAKEWQKFDKFDLLWPTFAQLGEQPVLNSEVYVDPDDPASIINDDTFGYQSRYAEYKYKQSTVHGKLKEEQAFWHMGRIFPSRPALNSAFISADPTTRIWPLEEDRDQIIVEIRNHLSALRPLPYHNVPTL